MEKEIILTPEELYYLGKMLQAKYIDYAYVAAMDDIGSNYALFEKETQAALVSAGILSEDFSGNLEIDETALSLVKPIFFGEVETSLDICTLGEQNTVSVNKFHFCDGVISRVTGENGRLAITAVDLLDIQQQVESLLPESYAVETAVAAEIANDSITRFLAVKSTVVGQHAQVVTFIEADGVFYRENGEAIESVSKEDFTRDAYEIVKGV